MRLRIALVVLTLAAAVGCGTDYAAVLTDAHRLSAEGKAKVVANCGPQSGGVCPTLFEASSLVDAAIDVADEAIDSGVQLAEKATAAWTRAKAFVEAVKSLFAGKTAAKPVLPPLPPPAPVVE